MTDNTALRCEHTLLENGIHQFTIHDSTMAGADAYLNGLEHLYQTRTDISQPLRVLLNGGGMSLPISYTIQRGKVLMTKYPNLGKIRTAILTERMIEARLADSLMRLMPFANTRVRFFEQSRRSDAIQWLLSES
ncbi:MAG: hypothetical protein ABI835_21440 [Chloroflexota bacterium]